MTSKTVDPVTNQAPTPRLWVGLVLTYLLFPLILVVCSGDFGWWQAWVYGALLFLSGIVGRYLAEKRHPGILVERVNSEKTLNAKPWDKVLSPLMAISFTFPLVIVAGLDHRYGWTPLFPMWVNITGLAIVAMGYFFAAWALVENRFFSSTVRIQTDRGHAVCDSGPYKIVRHPGYAGNVWALPGVVLALGSVWTLIPSVAALIIVIIRTSLEDKTLQEELTGYRDYAARVRYRLFPRIY